VRVCILPANGGTALNLPRVSIYLLVIVEKNPMKYQYCRVGARRGLTLMELVVVLVILIGLAGIVVPMLPSMLTRTHTATAATNMGEIAKRIGEYQGLYNVQYPDGWDTLLDGTGNVALYIQQSINPNSTTADTTGSLMSANAAIPLLTIYKLTPNDSAALSGAGINTLFTMATYPNQPDPTFYPYPSTPGTIPVGIGGSTIANPTQVPAGTQVAALTPAAIAQLGLNPNSNYVLFGLGSYNSMIGRNMVNAPVHFSDDPNQTPIYYYARFGVVFKIGNYTGPGQTGTYTSLSQAVLGQVVDISCDSGLAGIDAHIQEFYQAMQAGQ
jgi:Tfp pilus assembly protein PilE